MNLQNKRRMNQVCVFRLILDYSYSSFENTGKLYLNKCETSTTLKEIFAGKVMTSYSSDWFTLLLLCASAPLDLCCDQFDRDSGQVKREPVDLVTVDYDVSLCQRIGTAIPNNTFIHTLNFRNLSHVYFTRNSKTNMTNLDSFWPSWCLFRETYLQ